MLVDLYGEEPVTPAPVKLLGTPEYYKFRQEDYAKRHPGETHFYYEPYGFVNCTLFLLDETKSKLSQEGKVWDEQVAWGLAFRLEQELALQGDNASQFEENQSAFNNFVYDSHVKAYMNENKQELKNLSFSDLIVIAGTPSINHLIGSHEARLSILKIGYYLLLNSTDETMTLLRENLLFSDVMHNPDTPWTIPTTE